MTRLYGSVILVLAIVSAVIIATMGLGSADQPVKEEGTEPPPVMVQATEPNLSDSRDPDAQADLLRDQWGIKIEFATLSAGGYMVDFRFRVLDPAKAAPLIDRQVKPHLVDQASGAKFVVPTPPKVGQLRTGGNIKEGTVCFIYFANPAQYIKKGNRVTVVIGDFEVRDIIIQ